MNNDFRVEITEIDITSIKSSEELHQLLKEKLGLPSFYGMNYDAFWDAITGMIELPMSIEFRGWKEFEGNNSNDSKQLKDIFRQYNDEYPSLQCKIIYK